MKIETILVAVDFSEHANAALASTREFAKLLGAKVHVVHAFEIITPLVSPHQVEIPDSYILESRGVATEKLNEAIESLRSEGVDAIPHITDAPAPIGIVRVAEEVGADLIVMGTRGMTGVKHLLLGSVAERTLRLAPCSVLTIKLPSA
jgi:nucleotide-binding universal stress UspA family protein